MGIGLRRTPGRVLIVQDAQKPFVWGFCVGKNIHLLPMGGYLRRKGFPTWVTHVIYAAAALAGDDSPGQQHHNDVLCICLPG